MPRLPSSRGCKGFSIIELMVVVAILAILTAIAAPSFRELIASQKIRAAASAVYDSMVLARSEAIKRNAVVSISSADLANGWSVNLADGTSVRSQEAFSGLTFSPSAPALAYTGLGRLQSNATTTVTISGSGTTKEWTVRIEASGRVCVYQGDGSC